MVIAYRVGTPQDLNRILPLAEAFAREQQAMLPLHSLTDRFLEYARSGTAQALENAAACVMLAETGDNELIGYAIGMIQEPPAIFEPDLYTFVSDLYVKPQYRRQGVATAILERIRGWGWVKGINRLSLVLPVGSPAQGLCEKLGLQPVQTMFYYRDDQP